MASRVDQEGGIPDPGAVSAEPDEPCPELEELAAYLDGKLPPARRAAVTRHLARCESCREVFTTASMVMDDQRDLAGEAAARPQPGPADPHRPFESPSRPLRSPRTPRWLRRGLAAAVAAVLVVGVGLELYHRLGDPQRALSPDRLAADLRAETALPLWDEHRSRGAADNPRVHDPVLVDAVEFRLGMALLDLRLALMNGNAHDVDEAFRRVYVALEEGLVPAPEINAAYLALRSDAKQHRSTRSRLQEKAAELEPAALAGVASPLPQLGAWTETCRIDPLAALRGLGRRRALRRMFDQALDAKVGIDPQDQQARTLVERLQRSSNAAPPADAATLRTACTALVEHYDPKEPEAR